MKYTVCYNDHEVKSYHKTARISSPLIFRKSRSTDILKNFVKSYNCSMREVNELDLNNLHLAIVESGEFIVLPTDVPIAFCVEEGRRLYVRHGKKIINMKKKKKPAVKDIAQEQPPVRVCDENECTLNDREFLRETNEGRAPTLIEETIVDEKKTADDGHEEKNEFPVDELMADQAKEEQQEEEEIEELEFTDDEKEEVEEAAQEKEEENTPAWSGPDTVIQFRKVLHSFGIEDSTYEKLVNEVRNEIPECAELKEEDLLQNEEFKEKVGKLLEESLIVGSPTSQEPDEAFQEEREAHDADDGQDLLHVETAKTESEETEQQSQKAEIINNKTVDKKIELTSSPVSIAHEYILGAYGSLAKQLEIIDKCCLSGPNPTAE